MNTLMWIALIVTAGLSIAGVLFLLSCVWYNENERGGWKNKPKPADGDKQ